MTGFDDNNNKLQKDGGRKKCQNNGQSTTGIIFLLIGVAAILRITMPEFPKWIFTWPMILIAIGIISGVRENFRGTTWMILLLVGGAFLARNTIIPDLEIRRYIFPVVFIGIGLVILFGSKKRNRFWKFDLGNKSGRRPKDGLFTDESDNTSDDVIDSTSIFAGIKKNIFSKHFKGGEVVSIMGGTEINLNQADIQGTVILETFQLFGGTTLIVPPHWEVKSELVVIFGGVDDKRRLNSDVINTDKRLVLRGTTIFGGIEIKSY